MRRALQDMALSLLVLGHCSSLSLSQVQVGTRELGRTTEKELKVVLTSTFGTVTIARGGAEKVYVVQIDSTDDPKAVTKVDYEIRNRVGYMDVSLGETSGEQGNRKGVFHLGSFRSGMWHLRFSEALPISFDLQLGVGKGYFDLTGLQVKDFTLSTGASDVLLSFDKPNTSAIENINIESGVSRFDGRKLGNANFRRFKFQGGLGTYRLDFSGAITGEVDVDLQVSLGILTIIIPRSVGARLFCEKSWTSRLDYGDDLQSTDDNVYISDNYYDAAARMNIRIESGLGSIKIRRQ